MPSIFLEHAAYTFFQRTRTVAQQLAGFVYTQTAETGSGSGFLHFGCTDRLNQRGIQLQDVGHPIGYVGNGQAFGTTDVEESV